MGLNKKEIIKGLMEDISTIEGNKQKLLEAALLLVEYNGRAKFNIRFELPPSEKKDRVNYTSEDLYSGDKIFSPEEYYNAFIKNRRDNLTRVIEFKWEVDEILLLKILEKLLEDEKEHEKMVFLALDEMGINTQK